LPFKAALEGVGVLVAVVDVLLPQPAIPQLATKNRTHAA
jgi:hypothetical protein